MPSLKLPTIVLSRDSSDESFSFDFIDVAEVYSTRMISEITSPTFITRRNGGSPKKPIISGPAAIKIKSQFKFLKMNFMPTIKL